MRLVHRKIDFQKDREYVLECHCRINYACDMPWKRELPYKAYRDEWFSLASQITAFWEALQASASDKRACAEILETESGEPVGYLWMSFYSDDESGFSCAEIQDIYIEESYRRQGIARETFAYAEEHARHCGAKVLRSGTGCENRASVHLHGALGYSLYRVEYEKVL